MFDLAHEIKTSVHMAISIPVQRNVPCIVMTNNLTFPIFGFYYLKECNFSDKIFHFFRTHKKMEINAPLY